MGWRARRCRPAGVKLECGRRFQLKAHTGAMVDVEGAAVQARWPERGNWQRLVIEKKDVRFGAILPGDQVTLMAHTGNMLDVQGVTVAANWHDRGDWQTVVIEQHAAQRRLSEVAGGVPPLPTFQSMYIATGLLAILVGATVLLGSCRHTANNKVEPFICE